MKSLFLVLLFMISQIYGFSFRNLSVQNSRRHKRFLLDTVHALGAIALHFSPECTFCKCYEKCHADFFGYHGSEIEYCGQAFWNSINCSANSYYSTSTKLSFTATTTSEPSNTPTLDPSTDANQRTESPQTEVTDKEGTKEDKRFLLDTLFNWLVVAPASALTSLASVALFSECEQCKCFNTCKTSDYFGDNVTEIDICSQKAWDSINCAGVTKPPQTTPVAPEILPNGTSVTQRPPSTVNSCDRICVIGSVAQAHQMSSNKTSVCFSGNHTSTEAFPVVCCGIKPPSTWKIGVNVMGNCLNTELKYSPVAAFVNGEYVPGSAGILVQCKNNGFQMAVQSCDKAPFIAAISTHQDAYYVIEQ